MNPLHGSPCWIDLSTSDREASRAFYEKVFDWKAEDPNPTFGGYANFFYKGVPVAGIMQKEANNPAPDAWTTYLATDNAAATTATAKKLGAQVIVEPMDVMGLGVMVVLIDPTGAVIGLWQPGTHKGFDQGRPYGVPIWHELATQDYKKAVPFYRDLLGYKVEVVLDDEMKYSTLTPHGAQFSGAGVTDATAWSKGPSQWDVYIHTDDPDETARKIVAAGGTIVEAPVDTPWGRMGTALDVTGVRFKIMKAPPMP